MNLWMPERIAVVGLGYVGLPLAVAFSRHIPTIGFDIDRERIEELKRGCDSNGEMPPEALCSENLHFTFDPGGLRGADLFVITVPTPVDRAKRPDLSHLREATRIVGRCLRHGTVVVY
ncbi:MAG: hypothetical protein DRG31_02620, partial [Deltaproteobacteria bacterium]